MLHPKQITSDNSKTGKIPRLQIAVLRMARNKFYLLTYSMSLKVMKDTNQNPAYFLLTINRD